MEIKKNIIYVAKKAKKGKKALYQWFGEIKKGIKKAN